MTTPLSDRRVGPFAGDDSTTIFPYDFLIQATTDLEVWLRSVGDVNTLQPLANYTVSGVGVDAGGDVTMNTAPATGEELLILGRETLTQPSAVNVGDFIQQSAMQEALDRLARLTQQVEELSRRALVFDKFIADTEVEVPIPEAADVGRFLKVVNDSPLTLDWDTPA